MTDDKIIIFGMGAKLKNRLNQFDTTKIVAVTDNYILSKVEEYIKFKIIRPEEIKTIEYDLIVICTGYGIAKEIYYQLTEILKVSEKKIMSECQYFGNNSWEPKTLLDICRKLGVHSITNIKKYFNSFGILSNTNVFGDEFSDISWIKSENSEAILLGKVYDRNSYEKINNALKKVTYNNNFKYIIYLYNSYEQESFQTEAIEGYSIKYINGLDVQIVVYQKQEKATIYVATHKEYIEPTDNLYATLWLSDKQSNNASYIKDNGDNISYLNLKINECTGIYWLWKNSKDEILGLNHYRRFFKLNKSKEILSDIELRELIDEFDILVGQAVYTYPMTNILYLQNSMDNRAFNQALQLVFNAIIKWQPDYVECFTEVMNGYAFFPCNMFITKRDVFDRYCEWLFSIIIPAAEAFDESPYDEYSKRAIGFFAERLLTVWLYGNNFSIKELPILLKDTT